jgi:serine/threonine protein kinase
VVIKQFQFAKGADWSGFKELEREISILKGLQHPQIPRYIESVESETGFCLVQEYIAASSLAEVRSRSLEQIQDIGRQILEILVYLQGLHPPVLHRDIKPENILCNEQGEIFLVDFGFSRLGSQDVAASSIMIGTTGFIPPELFSGREPTKASDLYSLGATLLSLITGTPSTKMDRLLGEDFRFSAAAFEGVDRQYASWLKKMTAVRVSDRFADAAAALDELQKPGVRGVGRPEAIEIAQADTNQKLSFVRPWYRYLGHATVILLVGGVGIDTLQHVPPSILKGFFIVSSTALELLLLLAGLIAPLALAISVLPFSNKVTQQKVIRGEK